MCPLKIVVDNVSPGVKKAERTTALHENTTNLVGLLYMLVKCVKVVKVKSFHV